MSGGESGGSSGASSRGLRQNAKGERLASEDIATPPASTPSLEAQACLRTVMQQVFFPNSKHSNPLTPAEAQAAFIDATESQLIGMETQEWTLACRAVDCTYKLRTVTGDGRVGTELLGGTRQGMPCITGELA